MANVIAIWTWMALTVRIVITHCTCSDIGLTCNTIIIRATAHPYKRIHNSGGMTDEKNFDILSLIQLH